MGNILVTVSKAGAHDMPKNGWEKGHEISLSPTRSTLLLTLIRNKDALCKKIPYDLI